jgi:hypothetical protein
VKNFMNKTIQLLLLVAICLMVQSHLTASESSDSSASAASASGPTERDIASCEKATKSFLASAYCTDKSVPVRYFTPEFASLWAWACTPDPMYQLPFYNYEPILETQDGEPPMYRFGPGVIEDDRIKVPVSYGDADSHFTKEFVFVKLDNRWLVEDIYTTGRQPGRRSEVAYLKEHQAFRKRQAQ